MVLTNIGMRKSRQIPKPKTWRSARYREFVSMHPCMKCYSNPPNDGHHYSLGDRGMGIKVPDSQIIPLCRICHNQVHTGEAKIGREWAAKKMVELLTEFLEREGY